MQKQVAQHLEETLNHLYINPLEKCNLKCKICYTRKTDSILSNAQMLEFIARYEQAHTLQSVKFCGGEVLALASFPELVNTLTTQGKFVQIITNGTLDVLSQFTHPNSINLIVSLDGLPAYHDRNRGAGNFAKSLSFLQHAQALGFHTDVFSIVTQQNLPEIEAFENYLRTQLATMPSVTYHPRKPPEYLYGHPFSNIVGETTGFDFLTLPQIRALMQTHQVFPPQDLGCYQVALASDGKVYGCCEGTKAIGTINDPIELLMQRMHQRLGQSPCLGCTQPDFMCGLKALYQGPAL